MIQAPGGRGLRAHAGFTLVEVMLAMAIVAVATLALAAALSAGAQSLLLSRGQIIAGERAAEAVESVFKARDNQILTWAQIRNVKGASGSDGGVFLDGAQLIRDPGADGLVNTADDGAVADIVTPGPDGLLGTADDVHTPLTGYTREIQIRDLSDTLRQLTVIVVYPVPSGTRQYVLTTYISAYA